MDNEYITSDESLTGGLDVGSADGFEADSQVESLTLNELNSVLGKQFPSKEAALKSVKDTFGYVGRVGQLEKELNGIKSGLSNSDVSEKVASLETKLKETSFYGDNPEYKDFKDLIRSFGSDPEEVVKNEMFQKAYGAIKAQNESEKSKSVIHSNPRIGQATDKIAQAKELQAKGNSDEAAEMVTRGVLEAFSD